MIRYAVFVGIVIGFILCSLSLMYNYKFNTFRQEVEYSGRVGYNVMTVDKGYFKLTFCTFSQIDSVKTADSLNCIRVIGKLKKYN